MTSETLRLHLGARGRRSHGHRRPGERSPHRSAPGPERVRPPPHRAAGHGDRTTRQVPAPRARGGTLVVHLRMTGRLRIARPASSTAPPHPRRAPLDDGRELRFVDPRTFGELFFAFPGERCSTRRSAPSGPMPLSDVARSRAARRARRAARR